jgi:hypothetical protein
LPESVVCENAGVVVGIMLTIAARRIIEAAVIADMFFVCI